MLVISVLASLNLPAALEDLSGDSVPQSILEKARGIVQQGGLQSIEQLIRDLPELLTRNREILDEVRTPTHTHTHTAGTGAEVCVWCVRWLMCVCVGRLVSEDAGQ